MYDSAQKYYYGFVVLFESTNNFRTIIFQNGAIDVALHDHPLLLEIIHILETSPLHCKISATTLIIYLFHISTYLFTI